MSTAVLEPGELRLVDAIAQLDEHGPLAEAVRLLPEPQRQVIRLHYWQDWTLRQIAESLGLSRGRIWQIHNQALDRLRSMLPDDIRDMDA